jgi:hypothetical protein
MATDMAILYCSKYPGTAGRSIFENQASLRTPGISPSINQHPFSQQNAYPSTPNSPNSRILVTGANGYIGSTVVDVLLEQGYHYRVRGTVRSPKPWLDELSTSKYGAGRCETVVLPRLDVQEDFERVLEDVLGVIHVLRPRRFFVRRGEVC